MFAGGSRFHFAEHEFLAEFEILAHEANLEFAESIVFDNGATYRGYIEENMREGPGVQTWPDGARYEGQWSHNRTNGKGKFWHADGDIYDGEWKDDKADGYGVFWHYHGAKYEG